jgi:hypothetical protein
MTQNVTAPFLRLFSSAYRWNLNGGMLTRRRFAEALDFLEPHTCSEWLVPQFRDHLNGSHQRDYAKEGQQQVLRTSFLVSERHPGALGERTMQQQHRSFSCFRTGKMVTCN